MGLAALRLVDLMLKCLDLCAYLLKAPLIEHPAEYLEALASIHELDTAATVDFGPLQSLQLQLETVADRSAVQTFHRTPRSTLPSRTAGRVTIAAA